LSEEPGEREKIEAILRVEPFLSLSDYVFRFIARKDVKRISDHEEELQLLRRQLEIDGSEERLQMDAKETHSRLKELRAVMIAPERSLNDWVAEIVRYHSKVMTLRKNSAWLELQPGGTLKHVQSASLPENVNTAKSFLKKRPWFHRYYVDSVQSLRELLNQ